MSTAAPRPGITSGDRLYLTLGLAIITHAIVILGITFSQEDLFQTRYDTMEIILVQQKSEAPEEASKLAQADLEGGGDTEEDVTPASPMPPLFPGEEPEITMPQSSTPPPEPAAAADTPAPMAAVSEQAEVSPPKEIDKPRKDETREPVRETPEPEQPSAAELLTRSYKIAALSAELNRKLESRAKRPRQKYISASTRAYKYAAYMDAWRAKVERVGNLNYPEEARRRNLSGSLVLDVALKPDGSIHEIIVRRSSGRKILDDAAIRIVELASPFAPFPEDIEKETDILHITRTWQFLNNRGFR